MTDLVVANITANSTEPILISEPVADFSETQMTSIEIDPMD